MIQWNKVTWYSQITAVVLGVGIFIIGFYLGNTTIALKAPVTSNYENHTHEIYTPPILYLPLSYFAKDSIKWEGALNIWKMAGVDVGYQSFPTTTVTLSENDYANKITELPILKSKETITTIKKFDVDGDGKDETVMGLCGGGNHCPDKVIIVKNNKIIFSTSAGGIGPNITDTGTSNGFYIEWAPWLHDGSKWDVGLCCLPGYKKTRFVFKDEKFIPVYEQEVLYAEVRNRK